MSIPLISSDFQTARDGLIRITDIAMPAPLTPPHEVLNDAQGTIDNNTAAREIKQPDLKDIDNLFGPLRFGDLSVSRVELHSMGALLNGEIITGSLTYFAEPDQAFIDALEFDPVKVEHRIKTVETDQTHLPATLLFEIATKRSISAAPLLKQPEPGRSAVPLERIGSLLKTAQRLDIQKISLPAHLPDWVDKTKSHGMASMGVGLQAYGLYSALIGTTDALKKGHWDEAAVNIGGGVAEIGSLIVERGLAKTGEAMIRSGAKTFELFGRTTVGQLLSRGAGLFASVLTLPFDLYTAIKSFNDAANAQSKTAQDLYVNGALSLTSAGVSTILGCAALLGFKAAGPVGIAAAAILIIGAKVYSAARVVDDIDDYIELTVHERWRTGWLAFTGQDLDQEVADRFSVAKTYSDYASALETTSAGWLKNELRDSVEAVVNGRFEVTLQPTRYQKFQWDAEGGESPYITVNVPAIKETDDVYNAREGLSPGTPGVVAGETGAGKGILWALGAGNDSIVGVQDKSNYFNYASGTKSLTGGDLDDSFLFQSAAEGLKKTPAAEHVSSLNGGAGIDTLSLQGRHVPVRHGPDDNAYTGYDIDLKNGTLGLRLPEADATPILHSTLDSIEKVETLAGASNRVTGSDQTDTIVASGNDSIDAGAGDDQIFIRGNECQVNGGSGVDSYYLNDLSHFVSITEDGQDISTLHLGVTLELIQSWRIHDNALIISSLRSTDEYGPQRQLIIKDVYAKLEGTRRLRNDKLLFITSDGYQLKADLPSEIADFSEQSIKVIVVAPGVPKDPPVIVNSKIQRVPNEKHQNYFVSRETYRTTFSVDAQKKNTSSTLYIDFDDDEISNVNAIYVVTATGRSSFTYLSYSHIHFQIHFNNGCSLLIHGAAREGSGKKSDRGSGIMTSGWETIHAFTLTMRNGKSYSLDYPQNSYLEDKENPGYRTIESRASLRQRPGKYLLVEPAFERRVLKSVSQRIDISSALHNTVYLLEGQASSYDIYLASNTRLSLSTPDTATGSTWSIYTEHLREIITRQELIISNSVLKIGSIHIRLPNSASPGVPLEQVSVTISSGNRYHISTLFEIILLDAVNAQAYSSINAIQSDIKFHKQRGELNNDLTYVKNIRMTDLTAGNIYYDTEMNNWTIDTDWSRIIKIEDLTIVDKVISIAST
ncbi:calcium-binding protein [Pseudomonas sp. CLCA07]